MNVSWVILGSDIIFVCFFLYIWGMGVVMRALVIESCRVIIRVYMVLFSEDYYKGFMIIRYYYRWE